MKTPLLYFIVCCSFCFLSSCGGDHTSQNGKDTVINTYKTQKDTSKADTSKAVSTDNSASGGVNAGDTAKQKAPKK